MRVGVRVAVAGAAQHTRAWLRARAQVAGFDAAPHHEAGPSVQMMRVRFCLEAAEKPSYPAAYGILAMRMSTFLLLLSYVVWPRHMMVRRATSARGAVPGPALRLMGRRDGLGEASLRFFGAAPFPAQADPKRRLSSTLRRWASGTSNVRPCNQFLPRVADAKDYAFGLALVRH